MLSVGSEDPEMEAAVRKARQTWPQFVKLFAEPQGRSFSVKREFAEGDESEFMWVAVEQLDGETIVGTLGNEPYSLKKIKLGDKVKFPVSEVEDWMVFTSDGFEGGYTAKLLMERQDKAKSEG